MAFVLPADTEYGMGRMWQAYGDGDGKISHVFRTRTEADEWIRINLKNSNPEL